MAISRTSAGAHSNSLANNVIPGNVVDEAITRLAVSIACIVYLVAYAPLFLPHTWVPESLSFLRYLFYAIPVILVTPLLFQHTLRINKAASVLLLAYISVGFVGYFLNVEHTRQFFSNFIIINLIIISFVPIINVSAKQISIIFYGTLIYFAAYIYVTYDRGFRLFEILQAGTASGLSDAWGRGEGLLGPLYAIFFCATGATSQFCLALVMTLLAGKRVGVLALLIGLIFIFLFKRMAVFKKKFNRFIALLATLAVINIAALNMTSIAEVLHQSLQIGTPIEEVMLGRYEIGSDLTNDIASRPLVEWLFGSGAGSAVARVRDETADLPHNDWLAIFYDYGLLGSIAATVFIALIFSSSATAAAIAVVMAITMMTDNVAIYLYYQIPIVFIVAWSARRENRALAGPYARSRPGLLLG